FDVMGGFRARYRAMSDNVSTTNIRDRPPPTIPPEPGVGKGGQKFQFHYALPVETDGELWDGRKFADVREFKRLLLADEKPIARNLARQFIVYATGAPVRFTDRAAVDRILSRASAGGYGVRTLLHEVVQSDLFLTK
ncbi:MAG: DUF1585 domain-containing protein, partial [Opitutaceae bacterium]|nr:DUF1585 domain-containing protein [Opitutaceae bacterium]